LHEKEQKIHGTFQDIFSFSFSKARMMSGGTPFEEDDQSHQHHHELENVYDVWIATRSKLRGYSTVVFDRLQRVLLLFGSEEERRREGEEGGEEDEKGIRSVVFVRGSGQCVGKAIQVAEYVSRRFVGGTVHRQVTIGTIRAGQRVFHGHDETMQPSFPRDRPMISLGLSLDKKRLKETMDLL
jgi:hypothetical protein